MIRVLITEALLSAALSSRVSSASMSAGLILSGSNLIWNEALAGQISVTPAIRLSLTALVTAEGIACLHGQTLLVRSVETHFVRAGARANACRKLPREPRGRRPEPDE